MQPVDTVHIIRSLTDGFPVAGLLWIVLGIVFITFGIFSTLMLWHWREYSTGKYTTTVNMTVYLAVGFGLLIVMALAASWYSAS